MDQGKIINNTLKQIKEVLATLKGGFSPEQFAQVLAMVTLYLEKPKGDKGDDSKPEDVAEKLKNDTEFLEKTKGEKGDSIKGDTPQRGVDYYTEEDIRVLLEKISPLIHSYNESAKKEIIDNATKKVLSGIVIPEQGLKDKDWLDITAKIQEILKETPTNADLSQFIIGVGTSKITVSASAPASPLEGDLWVDTASR